MAQLIKTQSLTNNNAFKLQPSDFATGVYFYYVNVSQKNYFSKGSFLSTN